MTQVLLHELHVGTDRLLARLRTVLERQGSPAAGGLLARAAVRPRNKPRLVLTGQFSSGKSSLIKALTDATVDPHIDADVATDAISEYDWDGAVTLVDTPGVQSGLREHDDLALAAIGDGDFVLFVVTVGLFDDAAREFLRHVVVRGRKAGQTIAVVTQAGKTAAGPGVRAEAVRSALGTAEYTLPLAEVDSVYYLRSLEPGPRSEALRERSGIDHLRTLINELSEGQGELAKLRQPLQLVRQLADEAQALFLEEPLDLDGLRTVTAQRSALAERRLAIADEVSTAEQAFKAACLHDVSRFVAHVTTLEEQQAPDHRREEASRDLGVALDRHAARWATRVNLILEDELARLGSHLAEISERPQALALLGRGSPVERPNSVVIDHGPGGARQTTEDRRGRPGLAVRPWVGFVRDQLEEVGRIFPPGKGIKGIADAQGGEGHKLVLEVGHLFGKKFRPWEGVRVAAYVGKAAKVLGVAVQAGLVVGEVVRDERRALEAHRQVEQAQFAVITELMGRADEISADLGASLSRVLDEAFGEVSKHLDDAHQAIVDVALGRDEDVRELNGIARDADALLARLTVEPEVGPATGL